MTRASGNKLLLTAITCSLLQLLPAAGVRADPSLEGLSIDEAIAVLESGGEFILYSTDLVKPWMRVTAEPSHWPDAEKTLNEILTPYDLQARSGPENTIMIVRDPGSATLNTGGILGIVKETRTGRRIEGAEVSLNGKQESARTSNGGHFSFSNLPPGSYVVKINETEHAWVSTHMAEVKPGKTTVALIDLGSPLIADLGSVIVSASRYDFVRGGIASHTYIPSAELEKVPNIGDDALRAVHRLPGSASTIYTAKSNIRGGEVDETLVRLDGLRLYNPFHLKDFQSVFSGFDSRSINGMNVYTGGFPAEFGDRMSGVIDITSLQPGKKRRFELAASFFNTSALGAGLFGNGNGEWLASIRRSNLDQIINITNSNLGRPRYFDAYGRIKYDVAGSLSVSANVLVLSDDLEINDSDLEEVATAEYNDEYFWLGLEHRTSNDLYGRTLLSHTHLQSNRRGAANQPGVSVGTLVDQRSFDINTLQTDWSWRASENLMLNFGGEFRTSKGRYDYMDQVDFDLIFLVPGSSTDPSRTRMLTARPDGDQYGLYASVRFEPVNRLVADLGLRWDKETLTVDNKDDLSPRISILYWLSERSRIRASWGQYYQSQGIHELQINDGITTYVSPQRSTHTILGFEHSFDNGIELRLEAYDKDIDKVRPRFENFMDSIVVLPELKPDRIMIDPQSARAKGVEISLTKKNGSPVSWWLSYTQSSINDRINGSDLRRSWHQQNAVSAGLIWETERWTASLAGSYHTGWPFTATMLATTDPIPTVVADTRNAERFGAFRTLDVKVERRFSMDNSSLSVFAEVANVLGKKNDCCIDFDIENENGELVYDIGVEEYLGAIPSLGFIWEF